MKTKTLILKFLLATLLTSGAVSAQEDESHSLDGIQLEYTYTDGASVVLNFYDGLIKYRWTAGPNEGAAGEGFSYESKLIRDDQYMVVWRSTERRFFVTMTIDLEQRTMVTSAISGYGTDEEMVLFDEASIHRVSRN